MAVVARTVERGRGIRVYVYGSAPSAGTVMRLTANAAFVPDRGHVLCARPVQPGVDRLAWRLTQERGATSVRLPLQDLQHRPTRA